MKVLVVGGGGREHALAWKIAQSPLVEKVYSFPGNPGIFDIAEPLGITGGLSELVEAVVDQGIDLTVIGPEDYLADGLVDRLQSVGKLAFGPTQAGARLESSKAFAKELMLEEGIPTAKYMCTENLDEALSHLEDAPVPIVLKADGLAAGKGVLVATSREEAREFAIRTLSGEAFGAAGSRLLIEEYLEGPEISALAFTDGVTASLMPLAQDHKAAFDGGKGPNTGGMGAIAPVPLPGHDELQEQIRSSVMLPILTGLGKRGISYRGVLYAGLILTQDGPKVLEFNCRFGDPETEVILPLLRSDLVPVIVGCATGNLRPENITWSPDQSCACVVAVSGGYPGGYGKGKAIRLPDSLPDGVMLFHNGTAAADGVLTTNGGRVITASALAPLLPKALDSAYHIIEQVDFAQVRYRKDIGARWAVPEHTTIEAGI